MNARWRETESPVRCGTFGKCLRQPSRRNDGYRKRKSRRGFNGEYSYIFPFMNSNGVKSEGRRLFLIAT
ncbi:hypothetical protein HMPREF1981_01251 [Bacteroides pyogenes F0041]|uniref:Uncharacterized protein n=1 Tax=Bacteroides pyogenes F0041 TaxID=1321819 RepID=U2E0W6_9BACE|nr:hypothetical protein HMPREF1981_01251 [Bacteroides pyogenes F0041]GAE23167.1 hypothetical protein JCM10003_2880 [Bacteroides pyogenes JCM 10003]